MVLMCVDQVKSIVLILEGLSLLNIVIEYQTEGHNLYVCNIDGVVTLNSIYWQDNAVFNREHGNILEKVTIFDLCNTIV